MVTISDLNEPSAEEEMARKVAHIIGEQSAAARALREMDRRRSEGHGAWITYDGKTWFVGSVSPPKD